MASFFNNHTASKSSEHLPTVMENNTISKEVVKLKPRLRFLDKIGLSRDLSGLARDKIGEISAIMVEAQKKEITQTLMLNLDIGNKERFAKYLDKVGVLNADIVKRSQTMERELTVMLSEEMEKVYLERGKWEERINSMKAKGILRDVDVEKETQRKDKWADVLVENLDAKVELVMRNHAQSLQTTLELLRDRALKGDDVL